MAEKSTAREAQREPSQNARTKRQLSPETVRRLLRYRPSDGALFWREREAIQFPQARRPEVAAKRFNTTFAGKEALAYVSPKGGKVGVLAGCHVKASQVCWLFIHGEWPEKDVSHKNGNLVDNRAANLELAERGQYARSVRSDSKLGVSGVRAVRRAGGQRFEARLKTGGRLRSLGIFDTVAEAIQAVEQAKAQQKGRKAPQSGPLRAKKAQPGGKPPRAS
jgi:hypothetical protein